MTITLSLNQKPKTLSTKELKNKIVKKLNDLVGTNEFFRWDDDVLSCRSCANVQIHNKVVTFLILFVDGHADEFGNFSKFGYSSGMEFDIRDNLLNKLESALDNIKNVSDINITIN